MKMPFIGGTVHENPVCMRYINQIRLQSCTVNFLVEDVKVIKKTIFVNNIIDVYLILNLKKFQYFYF